MRIQTLKISILATLLASLQVFAADFPSRPISVVVPFPAGGGVDLIARVVSPRMTASLGQPIVIENVVGASGNIGVSRVTRATADGYTLLFTNNSLATTAASNSLPFDPVKDLTPLAMVGFGPVVVAVNASLPIRNVQELISYVSKSPGSHSYSSCGIGTSWHFAGEIFKQRANVQMTHIPYKGCSSAIPDGVGGSVPILFNAYATLKPLADQGKLRIIAFASRSRLSLAPDVPTIGESDVALESVVADAWAGMFGPAKMPSSLISKLQETILTAANSTEVKTKLTQAGIEVKPVGANEASKILQDDITRWRTLVKQLNLKLE